MATTRRQSAISRTRRASARGRSTCTFATKEALFESLLKREIRRYAREWLEMLEADPRDGTLGGMYRASFGAIERNQFVAAMLRGDHRGLRQLSAQTEQRLGARRHMPMRQELVDRLQAAGVIRQDADARIVVHIMNMLAYGLVAMGQIMDAKDFPSRHEIIEGIADIFDRALTPEGGGNSDAGQVIVLGMVEARAKAKESSGRPGGSKAGRER